MEVELDAQQQGQRLRQVQCNALADQRAGSPGRRAWRVSGRAAGDAGIARAQPYRHIGGGISYVISPTVLFDANFGGTRMHHDTTAPTTEEHRARVLKIPEQRSRRAAERFPIFNISVIQLAQVIPTSCEPRGPVTIAAYVYCAI